MAKIYEALEEAQKGRKGLEKPEIPSSRPPIPSLDLEEEMISLHQSIDSILPEPKRRIIQFIGSSEGEGTSTIVREFARVSALKFGEVVLLMEADHHRPDQHLFFNLKPDHGWEEVVRNDEPIDKALYQIGKTSLFIAPISQTSAPNYQTFDSPKMAAFLEKLRNQFDLILIDSPPANTSPDGLGLSQKVDGVVLVLEAEKTRWPVAQSVKERITRSGGKILGIVFNKRRYYIPEWIYKRL
jgi:Mrp family chromosome partitioning ATPase